MPNAGAHDGPDTEINGTCHCGQVQFTVRLSEGFDRPRRCTCSYCRMRGAVALSAKFGDLEITKGAEVLTLYQFNTNTAKHYFCSVCGIYTHHQRRSNPGEYGINAACLSGISPFDFQEVSVWDGTRHPSDFPRKSGRRAGTLFYKPVHQDDSK